MARVLTETKLEEEEGRKEGDHQGGRARIRAWPAQAGAKHHRNKLRISRFHRWRWWHRLVHKTRFRRSQGEERKGTALSLAE